MSTHLTPKDLLYSFKISTIILSLIGQATIGRGDPILSIFLLSITLACFMIGE